MGYDLYIHGIKPISDEKKMKAHIIREACSEAHIPEPKEIETIIGDGDNICDRGEMIPIQTEDVYEHGEAVQYIDVKKLYQSGISLIRLWHSY